MRHPSTPADRIVWIGRLLAEEGRYGAVADLSRACGVPRQTLGGWRETGRAALTAALTPAAPEPGPAPDLARAILTLVVEGHASYRGVQRCVAELCGVTVSLGTIAAVVAAAGERAAAELARLVPPAPCALALDELFGAGPRAADLSAVDARTGVVWGAAGPVDADAEGWTLLLWELHARGLPWSAALHDGGHVRHRWGQTHHRLARRVTEAAERLALRTRYEATLAAGERWRGRVPTSDRATRVADLAAAALAAAAGWLGDELGRVLEPVVVPGGRVLDRAARDAELGTVLALLAETAAAAPVAVGDDLRRLHTHLAQAQPGLLTLAAELDPLQRQAEHLLGPAAVGLLAWAWAWQRRAGLGLDDAGIVAAVPPGWRPMARLLLHAWSRAVRTTSLTEGWHSLLRAHMAVRRTVSPGLLAILAIWHNHRVVPRGRYAGTSPLHRSGLAGAPPDWLGVLGYPPIGAAVTPTPLPLAAPLVEVAA